MVSVKKKICWFWSCFVVFSNFAMSQVISLGFFFIKFKNGMSQTKYKKIAFYIVTAGIWQLITKHGYWMRFSAIGLLTTKMKVCCHIWIKNGKFLFNKFFWNFHISEKKSADFSCLFTYFPKNVNFEMIYTTFRESHHGLKKICICLHFCITT